MPANWNQRLGRTIRRAGSLSLALCVLVASSCGGSQSSDDEDGESDGGAGIAPGVGGTGGSRPTCDAGECDGGDGPGGAAGADAEGGAAGAAAEGGTAGAGAEGGADGTGGSGATSGDGGRAGSAAGRGGSAGTASGAGGTGTAGSSGTGGSSGGTRRPSCSATTGTECRGESCCTSIPVPGGTFPLGRGSETCPTCTNGCPSTTTCDANETPEHAATIASYELDKYEVTVGRFRRFLVAYDGTPPAEGSGANPSVAGSGWQSAWNSNLPATAALFSDRVSTCDSSTQCMDVGACDTLTWTANAGANESLPLNCMSFYEAFAFCIWDGARLPTEAEFEFAAGGSQNFVYPWGNEPPPDHTLAVYDCLADGSVGCSGFADLPAVGSRPDGAGPFGHLDLLGSMSEWQLDFIANYPSGPCTGCVNLTAGGNRVSRGSGWYQTVERIRAVARFEAGAPTSRRVGTGFRCAQL